MKRAWASPAAVALAAALVAVVLVGCSGGQATGSGSDGSSGSGSTGSGGSSGGSSGGGTGMMGGTGGSASSGGGTSMMGGASGPGSAAYSSAGERIWLAGVGSDGREIVHTAPRTSQGALMMGGGGCASCHGANGRGGTSSMMMGATIQAPDVTYGALVAAGYSDSTIGRAIRDGLDQSGQALSDAMPRWQMSTTDIDATIAYMKVLGP